MSKALQRFRKEDPTFNVFNDEETSETIIAGMGELHLEIYVERIRREYKVEVEVGAPKVSYREAPTRKYEFNYKHKKQTGGCGPVRPHRRLHRAAAAKSAEETFRVRGRSRRRPHSQELHSVDRKGLPRRCSARAARRVSGRRAEGGRSKTARTTKSTRSDMAFQTCAEGCFREHFKDTKPVLLEPIMKVEIECPEHFQGADHRRPDQPPRPDRPHRNAATTSPTIIAEVPLAETFGYSTDIRSMSQGQGTFTMELAKYRKVPAERAGRDHRREEEAARGREVKSGGGFQPAQKFIALNTRPQLWLGSFCCADPKLAAFRLVSRRVPKSAPGQKMCLFDGLILDMSPRKWHNLD